MLKVGNPIVFGRSCALQLVHFQKNSSYCFLRIRRFRTCPIIYYQQVLDSSGQEMPGVSEAVGNSVGGVVEFRALPDEQYTFNLCEEVDNDFGDV
jgi:hypothetical protein